ncbi:MAG: hypothetical protein QOE90_3711 [Thermoplasmata archaeon]|jgi:outer membrane protein assembly factor BamB|nr:hypothetical protein [Thermoplasmata archaeon]
MRLLPALLAVLLLAPLAPARASAPQVAPQVGGMGPAFLAQMERMGALPPGATEAAAAAAVDGNAPRTTYRDVHATCDLDGDGVPDMISNDLDLRAPPRLEDAPSKVVAWSGANGSQLWAADNLFAVTLRDDGDSWQRLGQPVPDAPRNVVAAPDLNGDGACDVVAFGYQPGTRLDAPPTQSNVQVVTYAAIVKALSGKDGRPLWTRALDGRDTRADDAAPLYGFASVFVRSIQGFPTGLMVARTPHGAEVVLQTTDVLEQKAEDPIGFTNAQIGNSLDLPFQTPFSYDAAAATDHVLALDAANGTTMWTRDLAADGKVTNLTWLASATDLDGDAWPEIVLDQTTLESPRATGIVDPTGASLAQAGRGMAVLALEGRSGEVGWNRTLVDALAPRASPPLEEGVEQLQWEQAYAVADLDGDGHPDVMASWVGQELGLQATPNGQYRTHFVPLRGANGTPMWDARLQGWGRAAPLGKGLLGVGLVDVPTLPPPGGRFPAKSLRLVGLDAATGASRWTWERSFAENSYLSYQLALAQYGEALAPFDLDGDGVRDLVTPAQPAFETGRDQALLATSSHVYEVRSGVDGHVLQTLSAWGPDGRVVACGDAGTKLTVVSGHARRVDVTRLDASSGQTLWRVPLHSSSAPHAATTGIELEALGAGCAGLPGGATLAWADLQDFSFERRHEVITPRARIANDGSLVWRSPNLSSPASTQPLSLASVDAPPAPLAPRVAWGVVVGVALGLALGLATLLALSRLPLKLLAAGVVLVVLVTALPVSPALSLSLGGRAPLPSPPPTLLPPPTEAATPEPNATTQRVFDDNDTLAFTYPIGDVTGDGRADVVADVYCVVRYDCEGAFRLPEDADHEAIWRCPPEHRLFGLDGARGTVAWAVDLNENSTQMGCSNARVVGTMRLANGTGIVVERTRVERPSLLFGAAVSLHEIAMIDARDGATLWRWAFQGREAEDGVMASQADTFFIQTFVASGALFVEGVGWSVGEVKSYVSAPGFNNGPILLDRYDSVEWVARLDPQTGHVAWRTDTFTADPAASREAWILDAAYAERDEDAPPVSVKDRAWDPAPCCPDLDGDGVPDVLYRENVWSPTPNANTGPRDFDVHLVAFGGATGKKLWDQTIRRDVPATTGAHPYPNPRLRLAAELNVPAHEVRILATADLDGDGASDVILRERLTGSEPRDVLSARSGRDGHLLWSREAPRAIDAALLGDSDGDGAADLVATEWYATSEDRAVVQPAHVFVLSGRTGKTLWTATSLEAPADVAYFLDAMRRAGIVDVNGDGVGEVPVDRPELLGDQTVLHHLSFLDGRTARPLSTVSCVGTFCSPIAAPDANGDGRREMGVLSGDVNDLWLTLYDGAGGGAIWSRRVSAVSTTGYAEALPYVSLQGLAQPDGRQDVLVDVHLAASQLQEGIFLTGNGSESLLYELDTVMPQLMLVTSRTGASTWSLPHLQQADLLAHVPGATPGEQAVEKLEAAAARTPFSVQDEGAPVLVPSILSGVGAFAGVVAVGGMLLRFRRLDKGVPDLE